MKLSPRLLLILNLTFLLMGSPMTSQEINFPQQTNDQRNDSTSKEAPNTYHVAGDSIRIEGQNPVKIYRTSSREMAAYLITFLALVVLTFFSVRYYRAKKRQKAAAISTLSDRELIVAKLIQAGKQNKEIAEELFISMSTVKTHINNIYKKLNITDRRSLKRYQFPDT